MHKILTLALLLVLAIGTPAIAQDQQEGPWTHPEVLKAAINIDMSPEQQAQFRKAITNFLQGLGSDVRKLLNARNPTNVPRKIASKRKARVKAMDEEVQAFLTEEQFPSYEAYRDLLLEKMDEAAEKRIRRR